MDVFSWIAKNLHPKPCTSTEFFYEDVASQSGFGLPVIYQPFDANDRGHWRDRGAMLDFLYSTGGEGQTLLDFGPGDGWPSLIVAPSAHEVVGVDGSRRRIDVCTENARRLGVRNVRFLYAQPGTSLPFLDEVFDGAMAASSVEQTPDPQATLRELHRILRRGGRLRIFYESLSAYRDGREREFELDEITLHTCWLTIYDRHIEKEYAAIVRLKLALSRPDALAKLSDDGRTLAWGKLTVDLLEELRSRILEAKACRLTHPSGGTLTAWLREIGFRQVESTHSGAWFAGQLFDELPAAVRPRTIQEVDDLLRPLVKVVIQMPAPIHTPFGADPMITAVK
ncbi:MAG TPA: class I SAM-dependent methyltransferase [Anaerolineales bacterium]|nr:class I SAM-dependent methyltransferase [Anaerolineales bacterium]